MPRHITQSGIPSSSVDTSIDGFDRLRDFQREAIDWYEGTSTERACAITAPTGSGKSAIFAEMSESDTTNRLLLVYPTNALLAQQKEKIEANTSDGTTVRKLSGDTLDEHGVDRFEQVKNYTHPRIDVVVTNPDILQVLLSHGYSGDTGEGVEFFKKFSAVVYDEFHFYSPLAGSGILAQMAAVTELTKDAKVVLSSATPDDDFLDHIESYLGVDVATISATTQHVPTDTNPDDVDIFRRETSVRTHPEQLSDSFATAIQMLEQKINSMSGNEPRAAIIFNSVKESNSFQTAIERYDERLSEYVVKDNGFDTGSDSELPDEFTVLNTTSKGEVGLDYDLELLLMQNPFESRRFLQRAGRAGRQSSARIEVFGCGSLPWPRKMSYSTFVDHVYDTFRTPYTSHKKLFILRSIRTAIAVADRETDFIYRSPDIYQITDVPQFDRWKRFVDTVYEHRNTDYTNYGVFDDKPDENARRVLDTIFATFDGIRSLRGVSVEWDVEYTAGRERETTTYDLTTALKHYAVRDLDRDEQFIDLGGIDPGLHLHYGQLGISIDGDQNPDDLEGVLTREFVSAWDAADFSGVDVDRNDVLEYIETIPLFDTLTPTEIDTGDYVIEV